MKMRELIDKNLIDDFVEYLAKDVIYIKNNGIYIGKTLITGGGIFNFYKLPPFNNRNSIYDIIPAHDYYYLVKEKSGMCYKLVLYYRNDRISFEDIMWFDIELGGNLPDLPLGKKIYIHYLDIDPDSMTKKV